MIYRAQFGQLEIRLQASTNWGRFADTYHIDAAIPRDSNHCLEGSEINTCRLVSIKSCLRGHGAESSAAAREGEQETYPRRTLLLYFLSFPS